MRSLVFAVGLFAAAAAAQPVDFRPVVLTGADVPDLIGANVTAPVCYAFREGQWQQCPLQIDERERLDPAANYPQTVSDAPQLFGGESQLLYTAPQDYPMPGFAPVIRVDSKRHFDADDELVLMARFFGDVVSPAAPPFAPATVSEVLFEGKAVYLFVPTQPLDQSAGIDLVSYSFDLLAGNFPGAYTFEADPTLPDEWDEGDYLASNPEYSPASTPYYSTVFEDRWIQRDLRLGDGSGGYGPDILDRVKYGTRPNTLGNNGSCGRTIWSGSAARGTLGIQKDGPLRALRFAQGYNSGGLNYVLYQLYERYVVYRMAHQMHSSPGASMWFDLAPEASGMTYASNLYPDGVPVDGQPDLPPGNAFLDDYIDWDYLLGSQGSMVSVWEVETNLTDLYPYSYYEDDTTPEIQQCTGDRQAFASAGNVYITGTPQNGGMPWTDPANPASYNSQGNLRFLRLYRRIVPEAPNLPEADAQATVTQLNTPIVFSVQEVNVTGGGDFLAPLIDGDYSGTSFLGTASDSRPNDTGVATLSLSSDAVNVSFSADPFSEGDPAVGFSLTHLDTEVSGSGYVIATDVAGNVDSLRVAFDVAGPDEAPPVLTGTSSPNRFDGTAADNRANDTGVASIALGTNASNLALSIGPFAPGAAVVDFVVTPVDADAAAEGYIVATDVAGNTDSLFVSLDATAYQFDLAGSATYAFTTSTSGTITVTAANVGTDPMTSVRVARMSTSGVSVEQKTISLGTIAPGASKEAVFTFTGATAGATASFQVQDLVVREGEGDVANNDVDVTLEPVGDVAPPVLAGSVEGTTWTGTATDDGPGDTGIASVSLGPDADNLTLSVSPFAPGDENVPLSVTLTDGTQPGSGSLVATDVAGNTDSIQIELATSSDTAAPILAGSYGARSFDGTARDDRPTDTGLASVTLRDAVNLRILVDGDLPGATVASFRVEPTGRRSGQGTVVAVDLAGNESTLFVSTSLSAQRDAADDAALRSDAGKSDAATKEDRPKAEDAGRSASDMVESEKPANQRKPAEEASDRPKPGDAATSNGKPEVAHHASKLPPEPPEDQPTEDLNREDGPAARASVDVAAADVASVGVASASDPLPDAPLVVEVYPNPLRGAAMLRLFASTDGPVRVALYDLMGRRAAVVVDRFLAAGWHDFRLTTSALAGGVYVWRAETAVGVESGRLSVLR